jgi:uncharacterized protein with PIN domain
VPLLLPAKASSPCWFFHYLPAKASSPCWFFSLSTIHCHFTHFTKTGEINTIASDASQAYLAIQAWQRDGKGNHPAKLNFGDCRA